MDYSGGMGRGKGTGDLRSITERVRQRQASGADEFIERAPLDVL
jgi:hypothetical protein